MNKKRFWGTLFGIFAFCVVQSAFMEPERFSTLPSVLKMIFAALIGGFVGGAIAGGLEYYLGKRIKRQK